MNWSTEFECGDLGNGKWDSPDGKKILKYPSVVKCTNEWQGNEMKGSLRVFLRSVAALT